MSYLITRSLLEQQLSFFIEEEDAECPVEQYLSFGTDLMTGFLASFTNRSVQVVHEYATLVQSSSLQRCYLRRCVVSFCRCDYPLHDVQTSVASSFYHSNARAAIYLGTEQRLTANSNRKQNTFIYIYICIYLSFTYLLHIQECINK